MSETGKESAGKAAAAIRAKLDKFQTPEEFVAGWGQYFFRGGMLLRTRSVKPEGCTVQLQLQLAGGENVFRAEGVVQQVKNDASGAPVGMVIKFARMDRASKELLDTILATRPAVRTSASVPAVSGASEPVSGEDAAAAPGPAVAPEPTAAPQPEGEPEEHAAPQAVAAEPADPKPEPAPETQAPDPFPGAADAPASSAAPPAPAPTLRPGPIPRPTGGPKTPLVPRPGLRAPIPRKPFPDASGTQPAVSSPAPRPSVPAELAPETSAPPEPAPAPAAAAPFSPKPVSQAQSAAAAAAAALLGRGATSARSSGDDPLVGDDISAIADAIESSFDAIFSSGAFSSVADEPDEIRSPGKANTDSGPQKSVPPSFPTTDGLPRLSGLLGDRSPDLVRPGAAPAKPSAPPPVDDDTADAFAEMDRLMGAAESESEVEGDAESHTSLGLPSANVRAAIQRMEEAGGDTASGLRPEVNSGEFDAPPPPSISRRAQSPVADRAGDEDAAGPIPAAHGDESPLPDALFGGDDGDTANEVGGEAEVRAPAPASSGASSLRSLIRSITGDFQTVGGGDSEGAHEEPDSEDDGGFELHLSTEVEPAPAPASPKGVDAILDDVVGVISEPEATEQPAAEEEAAPAPEPEKKRGFFARLFGLK